MARNIAVIFLTLLGTAHAETGYQFPVPSNAYGAPDLNLEESASVESEESLEILVILIPGDGVPGKDYPALVSVPDTGFSCDDQEFPGYFADTADEAGCQVFHICQFDGRQDSFLCPNGTIFNQQYFVCDWWFNVDCTASKDFFRLNEDIGKIPMESEEEEEEEDESSSSEDVVLTRRLYGVPN